MISHPYQEKTEAGYSIASAKVAHMKKKYLTSRFIGSIMKICLLSRLLAKVFAVFASLYTFSLGLNLNMSSGAVSCGLLLIAKYVTLNLEHSDIWANLCRP